VGCVIYVVETPILQLDRRFVENPGDVAMRAFALAHFVVGWLFLLTSPRIRNPRSLGKLFVATALGVLLCLLFASWGGTRNPLLFLFFYAYFLLHEIGDEAQIYQAYGDCPAHPRAPSHVAALSRTAMLVTMLALGAAYLTYVLVTNKRTPLDQIPSWVLASTLLLGGLLVVGCFVQLVRLSARDFGDPYALFQQYRPLLFVYGALLAVVFLSAPLGSTGINLTILIHVAAWMVFVHYQLSQRRRSPHVSFFGWFRSTPTGFLVLHLGVMLVFLMLFAIRVYVWQRVGVVSQILASDTFCYWSLLHITIAYGASR
jgi:hypothetical protein